MPIMGSKSSKFLNIYIILTKLLFKVGD